jgi:hypothetical protein
MSCNSEYYSLLQDVNNTQVCYKQYLGIKYVRLFYIIRMPVYPVFQIDSIVERFIYDMNQFIDVYKLREIEEIQGLKTKIEKFEKTEKTKPKFEKIITDIMNTINGITKNTTIDYVHNVPKLTPDNQNLIWCYRTLLFYQLLIICTRMMMDESVFDSVYTNETYNRIFRKDIVGELPYYKMGIFGSITPTSDIDIGIQYSGKNKNLVGLSYIVSIFEDSFLIFTKTGSLNFDIETYADMMTLPNLSKEDPSNHPDVFYLNTSDFEKSDFENMKPYVEASILRNYVIAKKDLGETSDISTIVNNFKYDDFYDQKDIKSITNSSDFFKMNIMKTISEEGKQMVIDYMSKDYQNAREKYYELVNEAENAVLIARTAYDSEKNMVAIDKTQILTIMQKISHALVFRAESHTCPPTIMHIVRVLQANAKNPEKYKTFTPESCKVGNTNVMCKIGEFGYLMSMYEQLGYIYRFYLTYCQQNNNDYNKDKCEKKMKKYSERFKNAVDIINEKKYLSPPSSVFKFPISLTGGKKSKKRSGIKRMRRFSRKRRVANKFLRKK